MGRTEKYQNPVPGRQAVTKVCIDDFAFRKRKTYETIMADIDTHMVIDLVLKESSLLEAGEEDSCINGGRREIAAVKNAICPNITTDWQKGMSAN